MEEVENRVKKLTDILIYYQDYGVTHIHIFLKTKIRVFNSDIKSVVTDYGCETWNNINTISMKLEVAHNTSKRNIGKSDN